MHLSERAYSSLVVCQRAFMEVSSKVPLLVKGCRTGHGQSHTGAQQAIDRGEYRPKQQAIHIAADMTHLTRHCQTLLKHPNSFQAVVLLLTRSSDMFDAHGWRGQSLAECRSHCFENSEPCKSCRKNPSAIFFSIFQKTYKFTTLRPVCTQGLNSGFARREIEAWELPFKQRHERAPKALV